MGVVETSDDAARRRKRIKRLIWELREEITQLENCKQELMAAKFNLDMAQLEISQCMSMMEDTYTNLSVQYLSKRVDTKILPYITNVIDSDDSIKSNIDGFRKELDIAITDLDDAIASKNARISHYQNQL